MSDDDAYNDAMKLLNEGFGKKKSTGKKKKKSPFSGDLKVKSKGMKVSSGCGGCDSDF